MTRHETPDDVVMIYTTAGSLVEAETIGEQLVAGRHAACVNILPGMVSLYRWQGKLERAHEAVMLIKTVRSKIESARRVFREAHSYTTPAFLVIEVPDGDAEYLMWLRGEVG